MQLYLPHVEQRGDKGYTLMSEKMFSLVSHQHGFLGVEFAREDLGITVSYWKDLESIRNWKQNSKHLIAQKKGKDIWYQNYKIRICKVESDYEFTKIG